MGKLPFFVLILLTLPLVLAAPGFPIVGGDGVKLQCEVIYSRDYVERIEMEEEIYTLVDGKYCSVDCSG